MSSALAYTRVCVCVHVCVCVFFFFISGLHRLETSVDVPLVLAILISPVSADLLKATQVLVGMENRRIEDGNKKREREDQNSIMAKFILKTTLQKVWFQTFGAIILVKITRISIQNKILSMSSCRQGHTSGSNITKETIWWIFCNNYSDQY